MSADPGTAPSEQPALLFGDTDCFAVCFSGEGAAAFTVRGWASLAARFYDEVVGGCYALANPEWISWSEQLNDPDEWTRDEDGRPFSFHSEIGEISGVSIYRLSIDPQSEYGSLVATVAERDRLRRLLNTPETARFLEGVRVEVAHQVERWGTVHDRAKEASDWYWLVGYLAGKALRAHIDGDNEKAKHHCISSGAVLANWHTHIAVGGSMSPGSSDLQIFLQQTFGSAMELP